MIRNLYLKTQKTLVMVNVFYDRDLLGVQSQLGIMLARLPSTSLRGLDAEAVDVEVDLSKSLPCRTLVYHIKPSFFII